MVLWTTLEFNYGPAEREGESGRRSVLWRLMPLLRHGDVRGQMWLVQGQRKAAIKRAGQMIRFQPAGTASNYRKASDSQKK